MSEKEHITSGPEWDEEDGCWRYTIAGGWTLSMLPETRSKKSIIHLWRGGKDGPDDLEAMSDPLNIAERKQLFGFYESACEVFDDTYMAWLMTVLETLRKNHARETKKLNRKKREERQEQAERKIPGTPYHVEEDGGLGLVAGDHYMTLSNFSGRIDEELTVDRGEGEDTEKFFTITARLKDEATSFEVPAGEFDGMYWVRKNLGARAIIQPSVPKGIQHVKTAVLEDSDPKRTRAYGHTGWRKIAGKYGYLHAGGAIFGWQSRQSSEEVRVRPDDLMVHRRLPPPAAGAALQGAVRDTIKFWDVAPDYITIPTHAATMRAALGEVDFSLHLGGPTGVGKTALALLAASHYGTWPRPQEQHASYFWSAGRVEKEAYLLKDTALLLDEFLPWEPLHREVVDRVLRNAANQSGRGTLTRKKTMDPRALIVSTGEDFPSGESLEARILAVRIPEGGGPDVAPGSLLRVCSKEAEQGTYALVMASFIAWIAERGYEQVSQDLAWAKERLAEGTWDAGIHPRLNGIYGDLQAAEELWLDFAADVGAIDDSERSERLDRSDAAIRSALVEHAQRQHDEDPTRVFAELVGDALAAERGYLTDPTAKAEDAKAEENGHDGVWLGWTVGDEVYLAHRAAFTVAKDQAKATDRPFKVSQHMLNKRLSEKGLLLSTNPNKKRGIPIRKAFNGHTAECLHLRKDFLEQ